MGDATVLNSVAARDYYNADQWTQQHATRERSMEQVSKGKYLELLNSVLPGCDKYHPGMRFLSYNNRIYEISGVSLSGDYITFVQAIAKIEKQYTPAKA